MKAKFIIITLLSVTLFSNNVFSQVQIGSVAPIDAGEKGYDGHLYHARGNFGLGTSNPVYRLDVTGDINFTGNLYHNGSAFGESIWNTNGNNIFYNDGKVGIGTSNPVSKLDVVADHYADWAAFIHNTVYQGSGKGLRVRSGTSSLPNQPILQLEDVEENIRFKVTSQGNVGIGTTSPNHALQVYSGHGSKAAFGDNNTFQQAYLTGGMNVIIGEYGTTDTDILHLHGKEGSYFTYGNYQNEVEKVAIAIKNNGNVGIGTTSPETNLHIKDGALLLDGTMESWTNTGWRPRIQTPLGTAWASTNKSSYGDYYLGFGMTNSGWYFINRYDNGDRNYVAVIREDGRISCSEVTIALNEWKDEVFKSDYNLLTIKEVEEYINTNGHLPEIPAEDEMIETGLETSEMIKLQMQKIEELTLYTIEQETKLEKQENKIEIQQNILEKQQNEIDDLKSQNSKIKELEAKIDALTKLINQ